MHHLDIYASTYFDADDDDDDVSIEYVEQFCRIWGNATENEHIIVWFIHEYRGRLN